MSTDMLGREQVLAAILKSPLAELATRLTGPHAEEWAAATARFLRRENPWDIEREILKIEPDEFLLHRMNTFSPQEHFRPGAVSGTPLKIRQVDERLLGLFDTEEAIPETPIRKHSLLYATRGTPLRKVLAQHNCRSVRLSQAWILFVVGAFKKYSREDGYTENLLPVTDKNGKRWTLTFRHIDIDGIDAWDIGLKSASNSQRHRRKSLIFSSRAE